MRSSYGSDLRLETSLVALLCIFSSSKQSDLYLGDQIIFPYSRCGLTIAVNIRGTVISSRQVKVTLTRPNIMDAFLTAAAMCWWNFSSLSIHCRSLHFP